MSNELRIVDLPTLRGRTGVFRDRVEAGEILAGMLEGYRRSPALALGIPAGGIPVAGALARVLGLPLNVAVVSKVTLPWSTEAGYGAVAFDGTVRLNEALVQRARLSDREVEAGVRATREKVLRRADAFRGSLAAPDVAGRPVILVDDGLASGFTMLVAVDALTRAGARDIAVAVPTAHEDAANRLASTVAMVYCANLRGGRTFAVAEAYREWRDVPEDEALRIVTEMARREGRAASAASTTEGE